MNGPNSEVFLIGGGIGIGLMLAGFYAFRRADPPMMARLALGSIMLALGIGATFFWPGLEVVTSNAIYLGVSVALLGLGTNQLGAPLRRALGKRV